MKAIRDVYADMDGVVVDFDSMLQALGMPPKQMTSQPGVFRSMLPMPGAIEALRIIEASGQYRVWYLSKPPFNVFGSYADKAWWVSHHTPEFEKRLILTQDKSLVGDADDYLIEDRPHKGNAENFKGKLLHFGGPAVPDWNAVLVQLGLAPLN